MNKILFVFGLLFSFSAFASCEVAEALLLKNVRQAVQEYEKCALNQNDDAAQLMLGQIYSQGKKGVPKNEMQALLFYHLAADNGNAVAQTELAIFLLKLDKNEATRNQVISYMKQIKLALEKDADSEFKGELLHPYTLLVLASEPSAHKWYYPTKTKYSAKAIKLLENYKIDDKKKKILIKQASLWKQRKIMETAKEVLSESEFQKFKNTMYPLKGQVDQFERQRAIARLKETVENYLK